MSNEIKEQSEVIRGRLKDISALYGEKFDIDNEDHVIVGVYFLALGKAQVDYTKELGRITKLFSG